MEIKKVFMAGSLDLTAICPSIQISHLDAKIQPFAKQGKNGRVYLNVAFSSKKEVGRFGHTHNLACSDKGKQSVFIGDFRDYSYASNQGYNNGQQQPQQPVQQPMQQAAPQPAPQAPSGGYVNSDDLPF